MLSDIQISILEDVAQTFGDISDLERACRKYRRELSLANGNVWKVNLANLQRINPGAYAEVFAAIPLAKQQELSSFIDDYKDQPLPEIQTSTKLSEARALKGGSGGTGGGTIVKP